MVRPMPPRRTPDTPGDEIAATYPFGVFFTLDGASNRAGSLISTPLPSVSTPSFAVLHATHPLIGT
jgi:hypothetical protein